MAKQVNVKQSSKEALVFPIDWEKALFAGDSLTDVTIVHTPPSGSSATFLKQVASPISYVGSPSGLVVGDHQVSIVASTDHAGLSPEVFLIISVER